MAVLGLHCCVQALSICGEWVLLFVEVHGLLIAVTSLVVARGPQSMRASVVVARGLSSCDSWTLERGLSSCGART